MSIFKVFVLYSTRLDRHGAITAGQVPDMRDTTYAPPTMTNAVSMFVNEATSSGYVVEAAGTVKQISTLTNTNTITATISLTTRSTNLKCITFDSVTGDMFVGTGGNGIIRLKLFTHFIYLI